MRRSNHRRQSQSGQAQSGVSPRPHELDRLLRVGNSLSPPAGYQGVTGADDKINQNTRGGQAGALVHQWTGR